MPILPTITDTGPLEAYIRAARDAGCPADQVSRFISCGIVLQPRQLLASAAARACDHEGGPKRVAYGGARGGGKSHWMFAQLAEDCLRFPGLKCLLLRKVGTSGKEAVNDLREMVLQGVKHSWSESKGILSFPNGSRILLGHFKDERDIDKYLGLQYDVIGIEEETTLTDAKVRKIATCLRTSKPGWRTRIYTTTNPGGIGHARFKAQYITPWIKGKETRTRFIPATYRDNAFLNEDYVEELNDLVGWERQAWRDGNWDIAAGQFFTNWRHERNVIKPFPINNGWRLWCALDYGWTHYTVCYLFAESDDGEIYIVDEHAARRTLAKTHAKMIIAMLSRHGLTLSDLECFVAGADVFDKPDAKGGTVSEQYEEAGIYMTRADNDRINGAAEMLSRLGDPENGVPTTLYVMDRCEKLIECIPAMVHDLNQAEKVKKVDCDSETGNGGDDFYDAARYGLMVAPQRNWDDFLRMNQAA